MLNTSVARIGQIREKLEIFCLVCSDDALIYTALLSDIQKGYDIVTVLKVSLTYIQLRTKVSPITQVLLFTLCCFSVILDIFVRRYSCILKYNYMHFI